MLSERTIINGLILLGGMILGPYLMIYSLESQNPIAVLSFGGLAFIFCVFFFVKDRIALFPVIGGYFSGSLNFLPFGLTVAEIFTLMSVLYYVINYIALKRRPIDLGPRYFLFPILVVGAIVLYHDHALGLKALGGSQEGSRPGLLILLAILGYFCGINIPSPSAKFLRRIPFYCFLVSLVSAIPFLLTTYFPSLAPYVYYVSGNVNLDAYTESITGSDAADVARNGALAGVGSGLMSVLLCYYPISTWWHPRRWIFIILSGLCFYSVLLSGYRNMLFGFLLGIILASICYSRWRVLILFPFLALMPLGIMIVQSDHPSGWVLPATVQRSMSFLPGNWDPDIISSSNASNEFRENIIRVYKSEYLSKSPWVGNGFTFDPNEPEQLETMSIFPGVYDSSYYQSKAFIVSKNFHTGWISLYDAVGIIGGLATVALISLLAWSAICLALGRNADTHSRLYPLKVWLFCNLIGGPIGYFTTFGSFSQLFIGMCGSATVMVHLVRIQREEAFTTVSPSPKLRVDSHKQAETFSPLGSPG